MGDLSKAQLRAEVINNLGSRSDLGSGSAGETTLHRALDRVQTRIARANLNGWSELKKYDTDAVTVVGTPATDVLYTDLPTNLDKIKSLLVLMSGDTATTRVTQILRPQWDYLIGDSAALPTASAIYHYVDERDSARSRQLRWWPVPNVSFTLHRYYTVKPTPFNANAGVSDFEDLDDLIIAGTTQYMFNRYQAFEEAEEWRKGYDDQLKDAIIADRNKPDVHAVLMGTSVGQHGGSPSPWRDPFVSSVQRRGY